MLWGLRYPQFTASAHRRFGPTFTVKPGTMPPVVLTSDGDAVRRLLTLEPGQVEHGNDAVRPLISEGSLMMLEPEGHLARRRLVLPAFHGDRVRRYAELTRDLADREMARWKPGSYVAVLPVAQDVTAEVILQAVLGVADPGLRRRFRRALDDLLFYPLGSARLRAVAVLQRRLTAPPRLQEAGAFLGSLGSPAVSTYFPELKSRSRLNLLTARWWVLRDRLVALLDELIAGARSDAGLESRDDILATLIKARDEEGRGLGDDALRDDLITLIAAGHETTAATIAWAATLLADHPAAAARCADELARGETDYADAVVKEVLRIRTPIPIGAVRRPREPFPIDGHTIPAGTMIAVDAWGLHHDPSRFPEPEAFRPERFLGGKPAPYSWLPFGGGSRRCVGAALAQLEVREALAALLTRFELSPSPPGRTRTPAARRGVVIVPAGGGRVRVEPRSRQSARAAALAAST